MKAIDIKKPEKGSENLGFKPFKVCVWTKGSSNKDTIKPELPHSCVAEGCMGIFAPCVPEKKKACFMDMLPLMEKKSEGRN